MKKKVYFLHIGVDTAFGYREEEFFFYGNNLGEVFHEIMSTVRYYASQRNYPDALQADARLYNEDTGMYLCNITEAAYNKGIKVFRETWND